MNDIMKSSVLILNADRSVLSISSVRRVVGLYISGKINILKQDVSIVLHPKLNIGLPRVVELKKYVYIPFKNMKITKRKVFLRDKYICQYCGKKLSLLEATIDHVIPKSHDKFPGNTWTNMVTSCKKCNNKKGRLALHQCEMKLLSQPFIPKEVDSIIYYYPHYVDSWEEYIGKRA